MRKGSIIKKPGRKGSKGMDRRPSLTEAAEECQGYLKKKSSGVIKRWQKRYFVIKGHYMSYYDNPQNLTEKDIKGTIDLHGLQAVGLTSVKGEIQLIIDSETTMLHADTPDEAQKWVDVLQDHLPKAAQAANAANAAADLLADSPGGMFAATGQTGTLRDGAERPIRVTVTKGKGLKSVRANGSNAMVFVTAVVPTAKGKPESRHQFQISTGCYSNEEAGAMKDAMWMDQPLMLPGVGQKVSLYFTCVDWDPEDGKLTFMGQGKVEFKADKDWKKTASDAAKYTVKLGAIEHNLTDGMGKELKLKKAKSKDFVGGELEVKVKSFSAETSLCSDILKTGGDLKTSAWKPRYLCLVDNQLYYYDSYGEPRPKAVIDLAQAKSVVHPENILEMIVIEMPDRNWQFKSTVHPNPSKNLLLGGEWWYKMRQAANIDTEESEKDKGVALSETEYANVTARRYYSSY
jgi:hypothetical protein